MKKITKKSLTELKDKLEEERNNLNSIILTNDLYDEDMQVMS
jgi:hypothetical protein